MKQTPEFEKWLKSLKEKIAKAKILMRLERMEEGNFGDVEPVGDGLSELRIHQGKGYRIYFGNKNNQIVILLCGGDKSTQQLDIKKAKILAKNGDFSMNGGLKKFDVVEYLEDEEDIQAYLNAAIEEGDTKYFFKALGNIARARNISQLSKDAGMSREGIYKALSGEGNPSFNTVARITKALGLKLQFKGA